MNNRAIAKWWAYFEEFEKQLLILENLDKKDGNSIDISDEKLYSERLISQEKFQKLQKTAKELYSEIVTTFKLCLQSLENLSGI